jgi:hypothetical protein
MPSSPLNARANRYADVLGDITLRYFDTGSGSPGSTLGSWVASHDPKEVSHLRMQSGFFSADGLAPFEDIFAQLKATAAPSAIILGSNGGETLRPHVEQLLFLLGAPRKNCDLALVAYRNAYYHPKTFHIGRTDGSQAAYVGSANLGYAALSGTHVEAGIVLDTRDGDPKTILDEIAEAVDRWFRHPPPGFNLVVRNEDLPALVLSGTIAEQAPPRASTPGQSGTATPFPPRAPLYPFAVTRTGRPTAPPPAVPAQPAPAQPAAGAAAVLPSVSRSNYPNYALFAPGTNVPTSGAAALTGTPLPNAQAGLIYQLNRDSARHWSGGTGTANISVPAATVPTIRFGLLNGGRPRAQFDLEMRYIANGIDLRTGTGSTNVMLYGFEPGDTGHGDVRMLVPVGPSRALTSALQSAGESSPISGDLSIIEWPTVNNPHFRWTLLNQTSALGNTIKALFASAQSANQMVGRGACWLPAGVSPAW